MSQAVHVKGGVPKHMLGWAGEVASKRGAEMRSEVAGRPGLGWSLRPSMSGRRAPAVARKKCELSDSGCRTLGQRNMIYDGPNLHGDVI